VLSLLFAPMCNKVFKAPLGKSILIAIFAVPYEKGQEVALP